MILKFSERKCDLKNHAIIPIFIPHLGCPNDCVFCNQRKITARTSAPSLENVRNTIDRWLTTLDDVRTVEIAFYGGSFTGLDINVQNAYLSIAKEYKDREIIDKIHLSTRPDYIDSEILDNLKRFNVDVIELGVQSFDDEVLKKSNRGHSSAAVYDAVRLIKEYNFTLGIQLMIGLPGDSMESCLYSAKETVKLRPELARLYPTIVIDDTELLEMYKRGEYSPLSQQEAVLRTAEMYKLLDNAGITIMRVGLKSTDVIGEGGAVNGGTYHPAFRQLVEGYISRERIEEQLLELTKTHEEADNTTGHRQHKADNFKINRQMMDIYTSPAWFSNAVGNKGANRNYFNHKYPYLNIKFKIDETLEPGEFKVIKKVQ